MNRIKELRTEAGLTQSDVARGLSTVRTAVAKYETGQLDLSTETIVRLCEIFQVSADYLLGLSTQRSAQITDAEAELVAAYHAAPESVRAGIDALLAPYREAEDENTAAG